MSEEQDETPASPDIHFEPIVNLPLIESKTLEEEEEELVKLRAKLYRYDNSETPPEWKERGTGEVKILKHLSNKSIRVLMRRDKTLKICCNHLVVPYMELKPNCGSDRAWIWSTYADYADEECKAELLAIRFGSPENAQKFKAAFEKAKEYALEQESLEQLENSEDKEDSSDAQKFEAAFENSEVKEDSSDARKFEAALGNSEVKEDSSDAQKIKAAFEKSEDKDDAIVEQMKELKVESVSPKLEKVTPEEKKGV